MIETSHNLTCEQEQCLVCHSKLREIQDAIQPLFVRYLLERPQKSENYQLEQFK